MKRPFKPYPFRSPVETGGPSELCPCCSNQTSELKNLYRRLSHHRCIADQSLFAVSPLTIQTYAFFLLRPNKSAIFFKKFRLFFHFFYN